MSVQVYPVPAREARTEIVVVNSRFIATAAPVFSVPEAKAFVARVKQEFADASHNVPVYLIGYGQTVTAHCSDDGEPSGTAGRPALAVLRGSGLGDIAVVVTRYFGGTKLGTGGLVRAYGDAVREVLSMLPRAVKVPTHVVLLTVPYSLYERAELLIEAHGGQIMEQEFRADVAVMARFRVERFESFQGALQDISGGKLVAEVVSANETTIMPIDQENEA
jgi:uncharacterized YigZ family protein